MLIRRQLLIAAILISICGPNALAQDRIGSALNTAGRFLGYGYGQGGYHSGTNHQMPGVRRRHPASQYSSNQLMYPYSPHYQPVRPYIPSTGLPARQTIQTLAPAAPRSAEEEEKKPVGPPPEWLKQYLKENEAKSQAEEVPAIPDRVGEGVYSEDDLLQDSRNSQTPDSDNFDSRDLDAESDLLDQEMSPSDRQLETREPLDDTLDDQLDTLSQSPSDALLEESGLDESDLESDLLDTGDFDLDSLDSELESDDLLESDDDLLLMNDGTQRTSSPGLPTASRMRLTTTRRSPEAAGTLSGSTPQLAVPHRAAAYPAASHPAGPTVNRRPLNNQGTSIRLSPSFRGHRPVQPSSTQHSSTQHSSTQTQSPVFPHQPSTAHGQPLRGQQENRHENSAPVINRYRAPHPSRAQPAIAGTSSILVR